MVAFILESNAHVDFYNWYEAEGKYQLKHEDILEVDKAAIAKAGQVSFWEWDMGSALFFWRWQKDYQETTRKGIAPMFNSISPRNLDAQPPYDDEEIRRKVKKNWIK